MQGARSPGERGWTLVRRSDAGRVQRSRWMLLLSLLGAGREEDEGIGNFHMASFVGDARESPLADVTQDGAFQGRGPKG